jgi:subtilase-type serine protease
MGVFIMIIKTTNKLATSLIIISSLMALPNISYSKEVKNEDFLSKLLSSFTSKNETPKTTQIFEADIKSIKLTSIDDFEFSIKDVLKNYFDIKTVNKIINNISSEDDKTIQAKNIEEFLKLLPKSPSDKVNGAALIRLANQLSTNLKTIYEIKRNIAFQFVQSQGITLVLNDKTERPKITEVKKEEELDTKEASSSTMGWVAGLAGLGLAGGGGGGGSSSSSSTFLDESTSFNENTTLTATWSARQEYKNVSQYISTSTINPYTLVGVDHAYGRGLSGSGKTIAIVDDGFRTNQIELSGKTITSYNSASVNQHGTHVSTIAAGSYNSNSATYVTDNSSDDWTVRNSGSYPLLNYGTMGVAYNANLHLTDYNIDVTTLGLATTSAKNAGAIVQNNSWAWGTCQSGNCPQTIDVWVTYQNNNGTTDAQTLDVLTGTEAGWTAYLSALDSFQNSGVVVVAAGNDSSSTEVNVQAGLPQIATELKEAWLVVGNIDTSGSTVTSSSVTRQGNQCGVVAEYCIQADGTHITAGDDDSNGDYESLSGTSMAAPIVSGSVALLSEAFPNHTPAQLTDRILSSANNTFFTATSSTSFANGITHGYNAEFGHGILDLEAALKPITTSMVANAILLNNGNSGNVSSAQRFNLNSSQVNLGAAFGDSLQNSLNGRKAYFYDALNGGFAFNMGSLIKNHTVRTNQNHSFTSFLGGKTIKHQKDSNGISFMSDKSLGDNIEESMMTILPISSTASSFVGKNINIQNALSFTQRTEEQINGINSDSPFNIPFIKASEKGTSIGSKMEWGNGTLSFGVFEGESFDYGLKTGGFISEYGREIGSTHTSFFIGGTNEDGGFLETSINGAFAQESQANTTFTGISSYGWINDNWSYNTLGSIASTQLNIYGAGLLNDIDDVTSTSFAFEISRPLGLNTKDSFHIGISQPLRVETGKASVMLPQLYDSNGNLKFTEASVDLSPSGRQVDLSIGYKANLDKAINVGLQFSVSEDYGHIKSDDLVNSAFAFVKMDF